MQIRRVALCHWFINNSSFEIEDKKRWMKWNVLIICHAKNRNLIRSTCSKIIQTMLEIFHYYLNHSFVILPCDKKEKAIFSLYNYLRFSFTLRSHILSFEPIFAFPRWTITEANGWNYSTLLIRRQKFLINTNAYLRCCLICSLAFICNNQHYFNRIGRIITEHRNRK